MLKLSCLCNRVRVEVADQPGFIHECNCRLCSATGARWGYFDPSAVAVAGATTGYCREDKASPAAQVHFCARCGSTTHFVLTADSIAKHGNGIVGANMRLANPDDLAGVELRYPDGRAWSGQGAFGYAREPRLIGRGEGC